MRNITISSSHASSWPFSHFSHKFTFLLGGSQYEKNIHLIYTDFPEVHTIRLVAVPMRTISAFQRVAFDLKLILWFFNISRTCEISYWILVEITRISSIDATLEKRVYCTVEFRLSFDRIRQHNRYIDEETSETSLPASFLLTLHDYHRRTRLERKTSNDYCRSLCDDTATLHGSLVRSGVTLSSWYQGMEIQSN